MVFAAVQSHLRRFRVRVQHWRKWRRERRALCVTLHELNRHTIPEAERAMTDNAHSRVLRVGRVMHYRGRP